MSDAAHSAALDSSAIVAQLVQHLTFWFSDANLSKDRFLRKLIASSEKQYVPFATFLTFNKVKNLNAGIHHLQAAAAACSFLKISRDGSMVRRATPFESSPNELQRTVCASGVAEDATHESLALQFARFGTVVYVSIPRQPDGSLKGFAFVEFGDEAAAAAAVSAACVENMPIISKSAWIDARSRQKSSASSAEAREARCAANSGRCLCICGVPASANGARVFEIVEGFAPIVSVKFFSGLCYLLMRDAAAAHCAVAHFKASGQRIGGASLTVSAFTDNLLPAPIYESFFKSSEETRRNVHKGCIVRLHLCPLGISKLNGPVNEIRNRLSVFGRIAFVNHPTNSSIAHVHFMSSDHALAAAEGATRVCTSVISSQVLCGDFESAYISNTCRRGEKSPLFKQTRVDSCTDVSDSFDFNQLV